MEITLIQSKIYEIRGQRVMLDFDLAEMYGTETRVLKQAVRRNQDRFPNDFMLRLSKEEAKALIDIGVSQNVIPKGYNSGGADVFAFTELGVAMLSSVLKSDVAIKINISIMRAFVAMRNVLTIVKESDRSVLTRIKTLEEVSEETLAAINDLSEDNRKEFDDIYIALAELAAKHKQANKPRKPIGYIKPEDKDNGDHS
ncbi:ORF6N domain-containing protein [Parabacteroides sp. PF5-9]|uniref:ORF6N domain-containing protein n=1 Tax=Parabacteroides sp. PF5-9 TaxID=1742404 RepID=UPI002476A359|nr:ORF6N domain-containing protein [Parabacteroides sp. PF5-9]MDH6358984.1 hypothetical protein [Parabacteroides sp. PF5-9]